MVCLVRRLLVVLVAALAVVAPGAVFAGALPIPVHATPTSAVPSGLNSTVTFDARGLPGASNAGYYSRPVLVSNNTLGGLARGLARRALPVAAFSAAVAAAGWAIDALTKQVMTPQQGTPLSNGQQAACTTQWGPSFNTTMCAATPQEFVGKSPGWNGGTYTVTAVIGQTLQVNNGQVGGMAWTWYTYNSSSHQTLGVVAPQPVSDANLANLIKNNPGLWNDALHNPDGSVNRNPDVMAAAQALANSIAATDPAQQPSPSQGWDQGDQAGDEPAPGAAEDLPPACEWLSKLCEWIDWTQEQPSYWDEPPEDFEVPTTDPYSDAPEWNSGLGNGTCPAPRTLETFVGVVTVPFDIFCQLAAAIRGFILAAAYATAAFILLGVRRG